MAAEADLTAVLKARDEASQIIAGLSSTLNKLGSEMSGAGNKAHESEGHFSKLTEKLRDVGTVAAGIALGGLITQLSGGLVSGMEKAAESAESLGASVFKLRIQTGASAEDISGLISVFGRFGVAPDAAGKSLGIFAKNLETVTQMGDKADVATRGVANELDRMGISAHDAEGHVRPVIDVMMQVADSFAKDSNETEKAAIAKQLFGRAGIDLLPILNQAVRRDQNGDGYRETVRADPLRRQRGRAP